MTTTELGFLIMAVGALTVFGGALGWASWMESRNTSASPREKKS